MISASQLAHSHSIVFIQDACPYRPESKMAFDYWNEMSGNGDLIELSKPHIINGLQCCLCEGSFILDKNQVRNTD